MPSLMRLLLEEPSKFYLPLIRYVYDNRSHPVHFNQCANELDISRATLNRVLKSLYCAGILEKVPRRKLVDSGGDVIKALVEIIRFTKEYMVSLEYVELEEILKAK